jgi:uncharacterized protein (DUF952 family)
MLLEFKVNSTNGYPGSAIIALSSELISSLFVMLQPDVTETIYHITPATDFDPARREYLPPQFEQDGFIHCTRGADLMMEVANKYYKNTSGEFLLLIISAHALTSPLKYETLDPEMPFPFPHIYGPLNREAVVSILNLERADDGTFLVPPSLKV